MEKEQQVLNIGDIVRIRGAKDSCAFILRGKIKNWLRPLEAMAVWNISSVSTYQTSQYNTYQTSQYNTYPYTTSVTPYAGTLTGPLYYPSTSQTTHASTRYPGVGDDVWMLDSVDAEFPQYLLRPESDLELDAFMTEVYKTKNMQLVEAVA